MRRAMPSRGATIRAVLAIALACAAGCSRIQEPLEPLQPAETFHWVAQPIAFSPATTR